MNYYSSSSARESFSSNAMELELSIEGYDLGWGRWFDGGFDTGLFGDAVGLLIQTEWMTEGDAQIG